jgi:hypothetical protein
MILGVHLVDGRIAKSAAIKIRAALKQSVNAKDVIAGYLHTHPVVSDSISQDRARARAWAIHNVTLNHEALESALRQHYADMYVTGVASTYDVRGQYMRSRKAEKDKKIPNNWDAVGWVNQVLENAVNWDTWTPGNYAAEALLRPPGGLEKLLGNIKIQSLDMKKSSYDLLGNKLADAFAIGASPTKMASMIEDSLSSPQRALTVALTEGSRAANAAARDSYNALGVTQIQWVASDPEDEECDIDGEVTDIDSEFSNGLTIDDLPVHPNCRCSTTEVPPEAYTGADSESDSGDDSSDNEE